MIVRNIERHFPIWGCIVPLNGNLVEICQQEWFAGIGMGIRYWSYHFKIVFLLQNW